MTSARLHARPVTTAPRCYIGIAVGKTAHLTQSGGSTTPFCSSGRLCNRHELLLIGSERIPAPSTQPASVVEGAGRSAKREAEGPLHELVERVYSTVPRLDAWGAEAPAWPRGGIEAAIEARRLSPSWRREATAAAERVRAIEEAMPQ